MLRVSASGFVVEHFGDLQIYNQNRGQNSPKKGKKSMPNLLRLSSGCLGGALGQQSFPGSYTLLKYYAFAVPSDATWPIFGACAASTGFRRPSPLGIFKVFGEVTTKLKNLVLV